MDIDLSTFLSTLGVSAATAAWLAKSLVNQKLEKELQKNKHHFDKELAKYKSEYESEVKKNIEVYLKENEALIKYQSEAKARLYHAIGPLKFQLLLAARDCKVRITSHPRQPYKIDIDGHYGKSTAYRIARLLCLTELIERQVAYADFSVDSSAVKLLEFKKSLFLIISGSKITAHHPNVEWDTQQEHIFFDVLSTIGNALVIREDKINHRCMYFSEFSQLLNDQEFRDKISPLLHVLSNLNVHKTPILWVRLSCVAALCGSLISEMGVPVGFKDKPTDLGALIGVSDDKYLNKKLDKYLSHFKETMNEGL